MKDMQMHYSIIYHGGNHSSTNHAFVQAQKPDVSSLWPTMPGPQQTMWESHYSATLQASQNDASAELDGLLQWSSVLVV